MNRSWLAGLVILLMLAGAAPIHAHTRSQSFSTWTIGETTLEGVYQVDAYRATQLSQAPEDLPKLLRDHLSKTVKLTQDGQPCTATLHTAGAPRGDLRVALRFACPKRLADAPASLTMGAFFDVSVSHVHYIRATDARGRVAEAVLTQGRTAFGIGPASQARESTFGNFLQLGFEHVLSGLDHVAFLIALALLAGGLWRILIAVTGFTLGHSLTLGLVAFGVLKPDTAAVEALIGFTVAWAAGDALARARNVSPWYGLIGAVAILALPLVAGLAGVPVLSWLLLAGLALFAGTMSFARSFDAPYVAPAIAAIFGLAHGAGFAGPLLEMEIPGDQMVWTLLAFNLGVEGGQLAALGIMGAVLWVFGRAKFKMPRLAFDAAAALLFALGVFWFVSRALA